MTDHDKPILTRTGYQKLQRELEILLSEDTQEVAELLADARDDEQGEEAVFFDIMVEKERLQERIGYLKRLLANAVVVDQDQDPDRVSPGNRVTVRDLDEDEEIVFDLIGSAEVAMGRRGVSIVSPVGKALLGHKIGERVEVEVPAGTSRYKILKIEMIPDED